ncbi:hypothetical protein MTR_7g093070 [Medicago truncatula]|uniref:Uncharacterized protein n=1 Tax=Medicago truncatula TaxID=3880 RepID=G7KVC5_MEDTR|nr:hypothetical protein MTR_7g093070 [Medicago truncatula]
MIKSIYNKAESDETEKEAYASVIRAFLYRTNNFTQEENEHKELLQEVNNDAILYHSSKSPSPTVPDQPLAGFLSSVKSVEDHSVQVEPAKAATLDILIGKKLRIKWSELAEITDYDPGEHKVVYDDNKPTEFFQWIDLKKVIPCFVEYSKPATY